MKIILKSDIFYLPTAQIGSGAFGFVLKINIQGVKGFNLNTIYVAKCLHNDGYKDKQYMTSIEALIFPKQHGGVARAIAIVKDSTQPMIIFDYWNGGHFE